MSLIFPTIIASLIGLAVGSFINVVVFRTKSKTALTGRSRCMKCEEPIAAMDLIPVISFFLLKGRCRKCSQVIEWQYPVIELVMGVLFGLLYARAALGFGLPSYVESSEWFLLFIRDALMAVFLTIIFVYDFRYYYILDRFTFPAMIIALIMNLWLGAPVVSTLLGGLFIGSFFAFQFLVSKGKWVGGGDVRLGMLMGFLLGIEQGVVALFLSYVLGAIVGVGLILAKKRTLEGQVPFGTFMAVSVIITLLFGEQILGWYLGFFR
jgi:prepilin signal peptidase PulO-like enzyme (type II secretory pathway)